MHLGKIMGKQPPESELNRVFKNEKQEYRQNKKKIPEFYHVLLFCRINATTATGTRERTHGMPDCCVVVGIGGTGGTIVCMVPGGDVVTGVGMVTMVSVLFG